ncbi:MAG: gliding motility-associated C-terminal domain-containing protein [Bacteroidota bacterium]
MGTLAKIRLTIFLFIISFQLSAQGPIPTVGTDFWMGFLSNYSGSSESLDLFLSGTQPTSGTVSCPLQGWSMPFTVTPGVTTTITVPENIGGNYVDDALSGRGIHIVSDDTISVFAINFKSYSADGTLILPIKSLGTDYLVSSFQGQFGESELVIVSTTDGTEVEITPSASTTGGHAADVPYVVQLSEGQTYQIKSGGDLTGTRVKGTLANGDCRPFAVFSGVTCANVPLNCSYCDHIYDQNYPIDGWGKKYYIVPFLNSTSYTYRVIARDDNTTVTLNDGSTITLNSGQSTTFSSVPLNQVVYGDKPIAVIQYMEGMDCSGGGDPSMLILNSEERKIDDITFSTVASSVITNHSLNLIVETNSTNNVLFDGTPLPSAQFFPFDSDPSMSFSQINVTQGSHSIQLPSGFTAYSYGTGSAESYAYGIGSFLPQAVVPVDTAYCTSDSVVLSVVGIFDPWWSTVGAPNDTIHEGYVYVLHPPIVNEVYKVAGTSLVSGCYFEKTFSVESPDPIELTLTSSADTVCFLESVQFNAAVDPISSSYTYNWEPSYLFGGQSGATPTIQIQNTGWYTLEASSLTGCSKDRDSVYVVVSGGGIGAIKEVDATSDLALLCLPDTAQLDLDILQIIHFDDFDGGNNPLLWSSVVGSLNTDTCSSVAGDALYFNGNPPSRFAETHDMDMSGGGELEFYLKIATGLAPCDNADPGENVVLEYSTNGGANWTVLGTYFENLYPSFTLVNAIIPPAAQTPATRFRWRQPAFTAADQDVWALDNVSLSTSSASGLDISWSSGASLSDPLLVNPRAYPGQSTMYIATITSGICVYEDSVFITVKTLTLDAGNDTLLCVGTSYQLEGQTSLQSPSISWSHNTNLVNANTMTPTTVQDISQYYTVTVTEGTCTAKDSVFIDYFQKPHLITSNHVDVCIPDTFSLNLAGGSNYSWNNTVFMENETTANPRFFPSSLTLFILDYEYGNGCLNSDSIEIDVVAPPSISLADTVIKCPENSVTLTPVYNNVNQILWSTSAQTGTISVTSPMFYFVDGTNLCRTTRDSVLVMNYQVDQVYLGEDTSLCYYQTLSVTPQNIDPSTSYIWSNGDPSLTQVVPGPLTLSVTTTDTNFCISRDTLVIGQYVVQAFSLGANITFCSYETADLAINNPAMVSYTWNTGETTQTITVDTQGNYAVFALDSNSCAYIDTIFVDEIVAPFPIITGALEYCPGATTSLGLTGSYSEYHWSTGDATPAVSVGQPYDQIWVQVRDQFNCIGSDTVVISEIPLPDLDLGEDYSICPDDFTQLNGLVTGATTYQWSSGQNSPIVFVSPGTYDVQAIYNNCPLFDTITILPKLTPLLELGEDYTICPDDEIVLIPLVLENYDSLLWSDGQTTIPYHFNDNTIMFDTVHLMATAYGCGEVSDTISIYVENCHCIIYVPNTFTPDGNDFNNGFSMTHLCDFVSFELVIFDRWGAILFQTNDPGFVWDARNPDGSPVQDGIYTWLMTYQPVEEIENHTQITDSGTITVLR